MSETSYRDTYVAFKCSPAFRRDLDAASAREQEPASIIIRRAVRHYLAQQGGTHRQDASTTALARQSAAR
jgi:hypothetical protein